MLKKAISVFTAVLGIVMIVLSVIMFAQRSKTELTEPRNYSVAAKDFSVDEENVLISGGSFSTASVRFGADFYTYIYKGVAKAVNALDKISDQIQETGYADQAIYDAIRTSVSAQDGIYSALSENLKATSQMADILYVSAVEQGRKLTTQSAITLFCVGAAILVFGLYCVGANFESIPGGKIGGLLTAMLKKAKSPDNDAQHLPDETMQQKNPEITE